MHSILLLPFKQHCTGAKRIWCVWSRSHAEARELAVPDVWLWEAGIREPDVSKQHHRARLYPTCSEKTHEQKLRPEVRVKRERSQEKLWKRHNYCDLMVLLNDFVLEIFCLSSITSHNLLVFLWFWWSFCVTDNGIKAPPIDNTLSFTKPEVQRSKCWPTCPVFLLMHCYEALYFQWGSRTFSLHLLWAQCEMRSRVFYLLHEWHSWLHAHTQLAGISC